jgi:mono/diheme cytochrome c family protein
MMKSTQWLRVVVTSLVSLSAMAGCSGAEEEPGGGGGSGGGGSGGSGGGAMGVRLAPPKSYTVLTGAEAPMGTAPAPAKYSAACTACHQGQGQGFSGLAPETRHTPAVYAQWIVRNGRAGTGMTPFPAVAPAVPDPNNTNAPISDAELTEIITWLNGLPKPADGAGLYHDFCGNCHGPVDPIGGAVPINIKGLATQTYNDAVRMGFGTNPGMRDEYMPAFDAVALTDMELGLIRTFLGAK